MWYCILQINIISAITSQLSHHLRLVALKSCWAPALIVCVVGVDREETGAGAGGAWGLWITFIGFRMHHFLGLHIQPDQLRCAREYSLPRTAQNGTATLWLCINTYVSWSVSANNICLGLPLSILFILNENNLFMLSYFDVSVGRCDSDHSRRDWGRLYQMFSTHLPRWVQSKRQRATTARH